MLFFLVSLFITCSLGLLSSLQELVFVAVILLLFLYNRFWRNSPSSIWMVTGGIVPFSSFFGPNALLLVLALRFLFIPKSELLEPLSRLRPLAYLLLTWFLAECCFRADWLLYQDLLFQDPDSLLQWWKLVPPLFLQTAWTSYRLFLFFLLLLFFVSHRDVREVVLKGLLWGTAPAILIACGEHVWGESGLFVQHNEFWKLVGRYSGSFQDPNAFGVSAALLMALWLSTKGEVARPLVLVTCLTLFVLALFSGSRTFFIFLVVFAFFFLYEVSRKTTLRALLGLVILFVAILASYFLIPGFSQALPVGAQRLLRSFDPAHLWTSLGSRVIFSRIAFFMWKDAPLFGIGPNHFKQLAIPYGERVGYPLGIWTDNPNNFYLDLLVQFGFLGICIFLFLLSLLEWNHDEPRGNVARAGSKAFLLSLLLGPHLNFSEVVVLASVLLSGALIRSRRSSWFSPKISFFLALLFLPLFLFGIFFHVFYSDRGYYQWEQGEGYFYRWTHRQGAGIRPCTDGKVYLHYYSAAPIPLHLEIMTHRNEQKEVVLQAGKSAQVTLSCDPIAPLRLFFSFRVTPAWIPKHYGIGQDERVLGVQERIKSPAEALP